MISKINITDKSKPSFQERHPQIVRMFNVFHIDTNKFVRVANYIIILKINLITNIINYITPKKAVDIVEIKLPENAKQYLVPDNPRLKELQYNYSNQNIKNHSFWETWSKSFNLTSFRGNSIYIAQHAEDINELTYLLTASYVELNDKLNLFYNLNEDELFGAETYQFIDNKNISRDLLDSILEINFLEDTLKISEKTDIKILDIGAGYGRLAHRLITAMPNIKVYCTDAIPESTFICEYYLKFREVQDRAITVPFNEIESFLSNTKIDIAVNIHSFSECTQEFINWWLDLLQKNKIKYLMIVPHSSQFLTIEKHGIPNNFFNTIESYGYKLIKKQPIYHNSRITTRYGLLPNAEYYMFELQ